MRSVLPAVMALAMLLAPAVPVQADGGGDYPPPASGDWVITQDTWVENETILLNGNITVAGANVTFTNVTFVGNAAMIAIDVDARSSMNVANCVFISGPEGELTVTIRGDTQIRNSRFLRGSGTGWGTWMTLATPNASVTDCVLEGVIECSSPYAPVLDGTRVQNSRIGAYFMNATIYSGLTFYNCSTGASSWPDAVIANCSFENCGRGAVISHRTRVEDCTFRNCTTGVDCNYLNPKIDNTIDGCSFVNCTTGVSGSDNTTVIDSVFVDCILGTGVYYNASIRRCVFIHCQSSILASTASDIEVCDSSFSCDMVSLDLSVGYNGTIRGCSFESPDESYGITLPHITIAGQFEIRDSVLSEGNGTLLSIERGQARAVNATFPTGKSRVAEGSSLEVAWYLDTTILYPNATPADGAGLRIFDRNGAHLAALQSGPDGRTPRHEITEYIRGWNSTTYFTPLSLNATKDGLYRNLSANLNQNMDLTLTLADVTAPSIHFTSPANSTLLNRTSCLFSGTASDDQGIASVRLRAGTGDWVTADGTTEWNATLDLSEGVNEIIAEASDAGGNTATATISVRVDTLPPVVEITYPAPDILVNVTSIELTGRTDPGCTVLVDGEAAPFYLGVFSTTVGLQEGPNTIFVSARDAAGNVGTASVNVTRDTIPPALTLTSPQNGEVTGKALTAVSGTAEPGARIFVNGAEAVLSGSFFSTEMMLVEGVNSIRVEAVDAAGNRASLTARVILDRTPPAVRVGLENGTIVHSATLRLNGSTEPGATLSVNGLPVAVGPEGNFSANVSLLPGTNRIRLEATDPAGNAASLDRNVTYEEPATPRPQPEPEPGQPPYAGYIAGIALMLIFIIVVAWLLIRPKRPSSSASDDGKSGSLPAGREP